VSGEVRLPRPAPLRPRPRRPPLLPRPLARPLPDVHHRRHRPPPPPAPRQTLAPRQPATSGSDPRTTPAQRRCLTPALRAAGRNIGVRPSRNAGATTLPDPGIARGGTQLGVRPSRNAGPTHGPEPPILPAGARQCGRPRAP